MKLTSIHPDEDLAKVAERLLPGASRNALAKARQSLEQANPHLAGVKSPPLGAAVVVPDDFPTTAATTATGDTDPVRLLVQAAQQQIGALREGFASRLASQTDALKATLDLASSPDIVKLGGKIPEVKKRLAEITQDAKARTGEIEQLKKLQDQGLTELQHDLDEFLGTRPVPADTKPRIK